MNDRELRTNGPNTDADFWANVDPGGDCWTWTGRLTYNGYALMRYQGKRRYVHRIAWMLLCGPIPDGHEVDHLCRVRHCVNPDHLEPVTRTENIRRAPLGGAPGVNRRRTLCTSGHPLSGDNLYRSPNGRRYCRECRRRWKRESYARRAS